MILMYHKVDIISPTIWWTKISEFKRQLKELSGKEFVYLDDYQHSESQVCITFDDGYHNIASHAAQILARHRIPYEVFICSELIGKWNTDDSSEPLTPYLTIDDIETVVRTGGRLQWHTRTHAELPRLTREQTNAELDIPEWLTNKYSAPHFQWLSYPYGSHDARIVHIAKQRFKGAVAVSTGNPACHWTKPRVTVVNDTSFQHY